MFQWLCAFILAIIGVAAVRDSVVAGLALLAGSALCVPPIWRLVYERTGFKYRKSVTWAVVILGFVALVSSPAYQKEVAANDARKVTQAKAADTQAADSEATDDPKAPPYADEAKQYAWIGIGKDAIKAKLKDPDSAKFRDIRFYSGGGIPVACGEVNAKNSFGGYNGFERFIAAGSEMAYLESEVSDGIGKVWRKVCVASTLDKAHED